MSPRRRVGRKAIRRCRHGVGVPSGGQCWSIGRLDEPRIRTQGVPPHSCSAAAAPLALDLATAGSTSGPGGEVGDDLSAASRLGGRPRRRGKATYRQRLRELRLSSMRRKPGPTMNASAGLRRWKPRPRARRSRRARGRDRRAPSGGSARVNVTKVIRSATASGA